MIFSFTMIRQIRSFIDFILPYWKPYRWRFIAGMVIGIAYGLSNGLFVGLLDILLQRLDPSSIQLTHGTADGARVWLSQKADLILPRSGHEATSLQIAGGLLVLPLLVALRGTLGYLSSYCISWVGENVTNDLRCTVFDKMVHLSLDYFDQAKMGDLLGRVQTDTGAIHGALERGVSDSIKEPFTIIGIMGGLLWLDWKLTLLGLIFMPACVIPVRILGKKIRKASQAGVHRVNEGSSLLVESLSGIRVVKAFGLEDKIRDRFHSTSSEVRHHNMKKWQSRGLSNPILETLSMAGVGLIIVYVTSHQVPVSSLGALLGALILLMAPIKKLVAIHLVFKEAGVAIERLRTLLQTTSSVKDEPNPVLLKGALEEIALRDVHFGYGETPVLNGINLQLKAGRRLGIAGESGSGKSSLLNLLFRFYDPTSGELLFNRTDIRHFSLFDLRRHLALVSQDTVLFDGSIADNIACGKIAAASREEIIAAAKSAYAHEFITAMPQGYDTLIGERGMRLSGGQRQRMAIARAFIRDAEILVLDEATAALDAKAEEEVQQAIDLLAQNRTVICVAHRLATLRNMDEIIVLEKGCIVERGSFSELLKQEGVFSAMARRQGMNHLNP